MTNYLFKNGHNPEIANFITRIARESGIIIHSSIADEVNLNRLVLIEFDTTKNILSCICFKEESVAACIADSKNCVVYNSISALSKVIQVLKDTKKLIGKNRVTFLPNRIVLYPYTDEKINFVLFKQDWLAIDDAYASYNAGVNDSWYYMDLDTFPEINIQLLIERLAPVNKWNIKLGNFKEHNKWGAVSLNKKLREIRPGIDPLLEKIATVFDPLKNIGDLVDLIRAGHNFSSYKINLSDANIVNAHVHDNGDIILHGDNATSITKKDWKEIKTHLIYE